MTLQEKEELFLHFLIVFSYSFSFREPYRQCRSVSAIFSLLSYLLLFFHRPLLSLFKAKLLIKKGGSRERTSHAETNKDDADNTSTSFPTRTENPMLALLAPINHQPAPPRHLSGEQL
jgi:hypothetical protein